MGVALSVGSSPGVAGDNSAPSARARGPAPPYAAAMTQPPPATPSELRPGLRHGAELFGAGEWWEAHEAWEAEWLRAGGDERRFVQALILLAAALHKRWKMGSLTHRNFGKAQVYLDTLPGHYGGVDLVALRADVWAALHDPGLRPQLRPPA